MASDGRHLGEYDPNLLPVLRSEAAGIVRAFGLASAHVVIIGGLAPSLLVPLPDPGLEPHIGTTDLDLCLSVALIEGNVGEYERLESSLRDHGFAMARDDRGQPVSWRWRGGPNERITVEFFCAAGPDRPPGKLHRPGGVVGGKLTALALAAGPLIDRDVRIVEVDVELPRGGGKTRQAFRVAGPGAYLAAKADALRNRAKNKDAYDVVWIVEAWPGGQRALAAELRGGNAWGPDLTSALEVLRQEFAGIDHAGAVKYGRFMARSTAEQDQHARRAVGALATLLAELDALR